ncbi:MAG: mitofilin family membrane protein [Rhodospirillaceae bacterium]
MSDRPEAPGETSKKAETSTKQEAKDTAAVGAVPPPAKDKPAVKPVTADDSAAKKGSGVRRAALAVGAVLLVLLIVYASLPWWRSALPPEYQAWTSTILPASEGDTALRGEVADLRDAMGALRTSLRDLETRVAQQANAPQQAGGTSAEDLAALRQKVEQLANAAPGPDIDAVQTRLTELENSRAPASAVLSLTERVTAVETQAREASSRQENALAFLMSVLQLREALLAGRPFDAELRAVRATAPQDFQLTSAAEGFIEYAANGVPPLVVLRQRLNAEADQIIRASVRPDEGNGWWNNTVDRALSVVSVRRTDGDAVGTDTASIVSRAEQRLAAGNLSGAVGELRALQGGPADAAASWLRDANARLAADAATSELTAEALARVGARPQAAAAKQEG